MRLVAMVSVEDVEDLNAKLASDRAKTREVYFLAKPST